VAECEGSRQSAQPEAQCDRTEGLEDAATLRVALVHRGGHPSWSATVNVAAGAAVIVCSYVLQLPEHVGDRAQLRLDRLRRRTADLRSPLCADGAEAGQRQHGRDYVRTCSDHCELVGGMRTDGWVEGGRPFSFTHEALGAEGAFGKGPLRFVWFPAAEGGSGSGWRERSVGWAGEGGSAVWLLAAEGGPLGYYYYYSTM
jgi:hypothetical protein